MSSMYKELKFTQPKSFEFTTQNLKVVQEILAKYPENDKKGAIMPLLYLAQMQHKNWIPRAAMDYIASILDMTPMHVYEVANFYTMYNKQPVGQYLIQVCGTTPCWLKKAEKVLDACRLKLGIDVGETTSDKKFTLVEVECLGACVNAPVVQINNDYHENLCPKSMERILEALIAKVRSQSVS